MFIAVGGSVSLQYCMSTVPRLGSGMRRRKVLGQLGILFLLGGGWGGC